MSIPGRESRRSRTNTRLDVARDILAFELASLARAERAFRDVEGAFGETVAYASRGVPGPELHTNSPTVARTEYCRFRGACRRCWSSVLGVPSAPFGAYAPLGHRTIAIAD